MKNLNGFVVAFFVIGLVVVALAAGAVSVVAWLVRRESPDELSEPWGDL